MRLAIGFAALFAISAGTLLADAPKVGDKAPEFKLKASDGKEYSLSQFAGKKPVVIAWFPKAFTSGCTAECKSMKEDGEAIRRFDVAYFAASVDDNQKNTDFAKSLELDFPILSDPSKSTAEAYGVVHPGRPVAERWTFFIGADGKVKAVDQKVNTKEHAKDIAKQLDALGVPKK
ncbi:MAG TPA: redoxin domain-containing protein [Pirellulales bacterium]|jgi:peroxiredoxin Q/BCP|nr:redoxin domain-containing protein [Pirellulales bacterium]